MHALSARPTRNVCFDIISRRFETKYIQKTAKKSHATNLGLFAFLYEDKPGFVYQCIAWRWWFAVHVQRTPFVACQTKLVKLETSPWLVRWGIFSNEVSLQTTESLFSLCVTKLLGHFVVVACSGSPKAQGSVRSSSLETVYIGTAGTKDSSLSQCTFGITSVFGSVFDRNLTSEGRFEYVYKR